MKKSEAINKLQEYIDLNAGFLVPEQFFNFAEGLGMLPQGTVVKNYIYPDHYVMKDPETGELVGGRMSNQWEPE